MAVSHLRNTPITGKSYTTPADATLCQGEMSCSTELALSNAFEEYRH
jgi:hypothetical protein